MQTAKTMRRMKEATKKAAAVSFSAILAFSLMVPSLSFADDPADGQAAQDAVMAIADAQQSAQGSASTADKADTASDVDAGDAQGSDGASSIVDDSGLSAEQDANKANGTDVASSTDGANKDDKDDQSAESTIDSTDTDGKAGQDAGATQGTAVAPSTNAPGNVLGVDPTADVDPSLYPSEEETAESAIAPLSVDVDDPAQERVLVENRFTGINPKNTTVNLYDYTSAPGSAPGSDEVNSGTAAQWLSPSTPNINAGHALTFGNGMSQDMGYWNAGSGSGQGDFSKQNPGFQNIVQPKLVDGYPALSTDSMNVSGYSDVDNDGVVGTFNTWPLVGGYNSNPPLYAKARRVNAQWSNGQLVFGNAGGKNISDTVQNQWNKDTSLAYLFDTSDAAASAPGRTATHSDVKGLFQLDDHGYYYYNMRKNFAEYTAEEVQGRDGTIPANSFILYDEPAGLRTDGTGSVGNFFPFNTGEQVFKVEDGKLVNDIYASNNGAAGSASNQGQNKPMINHNLGMTMTTSFRQPVNGNVGSNPMTFEFIGDDDLWIFIDDVLVLDLGGIHSELYGTIDFSTGEVNLGTAYTANGDISAAPAPVRTTTIKDMFDAAGVDTSTGFRDNTFASNTSHTLKMFYFERGNYDSSLSVRFNLQPELYQQIKKVDQDGNPVAGAEFGLYPVDSTTASSAEGATLDNVTYDATATPLTTVTTGQDGTAQFMQGNQPFNFADRVKADDVASQLFILRESTAPPGYRMMPIDILMRYDRETGTFVVNNRYDTGSYASFNSYVTQISSDGLRYGRYDEATQTIVSTDAPVSKSQQRNGLVVGIPTLQQPSSTRWEPVYGSNNSKLNVVSDQDANLDSMRNAMLEAVLHQAYLNQNDASVPGWYMVWDDEEGRLASYYEVQDETGASHVVSTLSDLPGNPTRYRLSNPDGDMMMVYGVVSSEVFGPNASGMTAQQKYAALANRVKSKLGNVENPTEEQIEAAVKAAAADVAAVQTPDATGDFANRGFSAIEASPSVFVRDFRTVVNIPNEQRELRVWKVDQNESRVNGAVFGLFDSKA